MKVLYSSSGPQKNLLFSSAFFLFALLFSYTAFAAHIPERYDLVYIWDADLESVLDYKDELESLLGPEISKRLKVVGRDKEYGIIYDGDVTAISSAHTVIHHSEILRSAGLAEARAIKDLGYHALYNVSYGLGPNLDVLKKVYKQIYGYLGQEVGKELFIEQTGSGNYTLIYRRRGDKKSSLKVAKKHGKLLRKKKISTSITMENNNPVVFGESSFLNDAEDAVVEIEKKVVRIKKASVVREKVKERQIISQSNSKVRVRKASVDTGSGDTEFELNVESFIKELRRKGTIANDETTGWVVYDFTNDKSLVDINANHVFQAASMIKPFVALAFFHEAKNGKFKYGPKSRSKMEAMIQRSNNSATNWVMRQAGGPARCEEILRREYGHIFKNTKINEYIPASGRTYKNSALPADYIRFLKALWVNELPYGKEMRRLMALPGRDRLYHGTPIPQGTMVYNKTGSTAHLCGDMGILVPKAPNGHQYPYAIVGIIERRSRPSDYGSWTLSRSNVIREVSTLIYEGMKEKYKLL